MIYVKLNKANVPVIINNRVFKKLAESGKLDIIKGDFENIEELDFIEDLCWYGYQEGCRFEEVKPIDEAKFKTLLGFTAVKAIQAYLIEEIADLGKLLESKKKEVE